jgi:hypothetical protein
LSWRSTMYVLLWTAGWHLKSSMTSRVTILKNQEAWCPLWLFTWENYYSEVWSSSCHCSYVPDRCEKEWIYYVSKCCNMPLFLKLLGIFCHGKLH